MKISENLRKYKYFHFHLDFLPKICGCPPIEKFLPKTLWVPGPRGLCVPHPMVTGVNQFQCSVQKLNVQCIVQSRQACNRERCIRVH